MIIISEWVGEEMGGGLEISGLASGASCLLSLLIDKAKL